MRQTVPDRGRWRSLWALAWLLLGAAAAWGQPQPQDVAPAYAATVATGLRARPMLDAALLQRIAPGQQVRLLHVQGGWAQVRLGAAQGWVRLSQLRPLQSAGAATAPAQQGDAHLASLFTADSTAPVATTGTRGLSKGWVTSSVPDPQAVRQMDGYAASAQQARQFAQDGQVQARQVADDPGGEP